MWSFLSGGGPEDAKNGWVRCSELWGRADPKGADSNQAAYPDATQAELQGIYDAALAEKIEKVPTRRFGRSGIDMPLLSLGLGPFMHFNSIVHGRPMWGKVSGLGYIMFSLFGWPAVSAAVAYFSPVASARESAGVGVAVYIVGQLILMQLLNTEHQSNCDAVLRKSMDLKINHLETARMYMSSESVLCKALSHHRGEEYLLQTKLRTLDGAAAFREKLKVSLEVMGVDKVPLLTLHGLNKSDQVEKTWECLDELEKIKASGLCEAIGLSVHAPADDVLPFVESGRLDFVNLHFTFLGSYTVPSMRRVVEACRARDVGVFIISPLNQNGRVHKPSPRLAELTAPLHPAEFQLLWCMAQPGVHTVSFGPADPSQFDWQLNAVKLLPHAPKILPTIVRRLRRAVREELGDEWCDGFTRDVGDLCQANERAPGAVNVYMLSWLWSLWKSLGMDLFATEIHKNIKVVGNDWCCGGNTYKPRPFPELEPELRKVLADAPLGDDACDHLLELHEFMKGRTPPSKVGEAIEAGMLVLVMNYMKLAWNAGGYHG